MRVPISFSRAALLARLGAAAAIVVAGFARAQSPGADEFVEPAAATAPTPLPPPSVTAEIVRFRQQPAEVGDRLVQRLGVHLGLATKITQSGQTAHESTNEMRRQQQRTIEVLEVAEGRAVKARASFEVSRRQSPEHENPEELAVQPIEGKSYLMTRTGDRLTVTDEEGAIPPLEEFKLVAESLENVGKANPLAELLTARPIGVGERLLVPREVVQPLLGFEDPLGTVHRFELRLVRVDPSGPDRPAPTAVFETNIEVRPDDKSPLSISLAGHLAIETETCRMVAVDLAGPVEISSIERTEGGIFQFSAGGDLKMAIRSEYDRVIQ
jgi:hypothetical protein